MAATGEAGGRGVATAATNSKFDQTRYGSWSGNAARNQSSASCSHGYSDGVTVVQRLEVGFI